LQTGSTACFATLYLAPTGRIEPFWVQKILVDLRPKGGRIEGRSERLRHGDLAMTATAAKRKGRRSRAKLTQRQLNGRLEPGRYSDGGNLYFEVRPSGGRYWLFRFTIDGKKWDMGLGAYPDLPGSSPMSQVLRLRKSGTRQNRTFTRRRQADLRTSAG
jgi:hypothetical protein